MTQKSFSTPQSSSSRPQMNEEIEWVYSKPIDKPSYRYLRDNGLPSLTQYKRELWGRGTIDPNIFDNNLPIKRGDFYSFYGRNNYDRELIKEYNDALILYTTLRENAIAAAYAPGGKLFKKAEKNFYSLALKQRASK